MKVNWKIYKVELIVKCLVQLGAENIYICFFLYLNLGFFKRSNTGKQLKRRKY